MATPAESIAALNASLDRTHQKVQIQRPGSATDPRSFAAVANCRGHVVPSSLGLANIIISPTDLFNAPDWPASTGSPVGDPVLPRRTDKMTVSGLQRTIQNVYPRYLAGDVLVRVTIQVVS
jgi:stage V sporulation protein SpoVS